jgi:hypothetical protein
VDWILELKAFLTSSRLPRIRRRLKGLFFKLRATASRMVTCTGVAQTASL